MFFIAVMAFLFIVGLLSCNYQKPKVYKSTLSERREQFRTKLITFNQNKEKPETQNCKGTWQKRGLICNSQSRAKRSNYKT